MINVKLNSDQLNHSKPLSGKTHPEIMEIIQTCPDYSNIKEAFVADTDFGMLVIFYDDREQDWVGVPVQFTGGVHHLNEDGSYSDKD